MTDIYEKMGLFYLGKDINDEELTLYKSKYLTTHAAIIGMTGSGKTGLGIGLIEEAAIDNIPAIIIDPKGDMGNLCLTFPELRPDDFLPWIDTIDATNKGHTPEEAASAMASLWQNGIERDHQQKERIQKLHNVDTTIYTPGSSAGVGINILGSFDAPSLEVLDDPDTFAALINATVSSLLSLIGVEADSLTSKEFLLLSNIFKHFWLEQKNLSLETLIGQIASPPFQKIGVLNLGDFYPQNERLKLAMLFNNVLSSVSFSAWISGEPLDIQNLLYDAEGKAKISIFSIAHLTEQQRMFFVTLLLNRFIGWMRSQRGSSTLKALLYMDEIFGFFPPVKNPPSKEPMMLLLKQARAFGVGVILSTQNPGDIDYKGLSNIGTWFIGKLQTRQDINKVIEALSGKIKDMGKSEISVMIAGLAGRTFFLKSAHEEHVRIFSTRWVLSYLKGPMSKNDIRLLMQHKKSKPKERLHANAAAAASKEQSSMKHKPILSDEIIEYFNDTSMNKKNIFLPSLAASAQVRFYNQRRGIDEAEDLQLKIELDEHTSVVAWEDSTTMQTPLEKLPHKSMAQASFAPLPPIIGTAKNLKLFERSLKDYLYHTKTIELFRCKALKLESKPHQSLRDFKVILQDILSEKKESAVEKLTSRYRTREQRLEKRLQRAMQKLNKEESDVTAKTADTAISVGMTILGAFFGNSRSTLSKGSRALRGGKSVMKERNDVARAESVIAEIEEEIASVNDELEEKIYDLDETFAVDNYEIETFTIKPRKTDIIVKNVAILWEK